MAEGVEGVRVSHRADAHLLQLLRREDAEDRLGQKRPALRRHRQRPHGETPLTDSLLSIGSPASFVLFLLSFEGITIAFEIVVVARERKHLLRLSL